MFFFQSLTGLEFPYCPPLLIYRIPEEYFPLEKDKIVDQKFLSNELLKHEQEIVFIYN